MISPSSELRFDRFFFSIWVFFRKESKYAICFWKYFTKNFQIFPTNSRTQKFSLSFHVENYIQYACIFPAFSIFMFLEFILKLNRFNALQLLQWSISLWYHVEIWITDMLSTEILLITHYFIFMHNTKSLLPLIITCGNKINCMHTLKP